MINILDEANIEELLQQQIIGHLGCHADETTYVVPISYAYDGENIYAHTHEGKKIDMMRKNPKVCFQVDDLTDLSDWKSVIIMGEFKELTDNEERKGAMQHLLKRELPLKTTTTTHIGEMWPFDTNSIDIKGIVFKIKITEKNGRAEQNDSSYKKW